MKVGNAQNDCRNISCGSDVNGGSLIDIRFPFQLVDGKTSNDHCGYPGFDVSCANNRTMLELPSNSALPGVSLSVGWIDYESRQLRASDPKGCLPRLFLQLYNTSIYPFQFDSLDPKTVEYSVIPSNVTFFDCSSVGSRYLTNKYASISLPQDMFVCPIYAAGSDESVVKLNLVSCTKILEMVSPVPADYLQSNNLGLRWSKPKCDAQNFHCNRNPSKIIKIILPTTGYTTSLCFFFFFFSFFYLLHLAFGMFNVVM